ncbi:stage III sporulation protein AA [Caloranaerobacter sp. TR13]|uniref:stage III sporulation protein AA n=1 Tax=Caloranaerobacter sp. TR13 TaxID=1302151 RepID=UPI0009E831EE|nr:stage III sporulation protein AA [Caloranaerobacter sp. TR13]
MEQQMINIYENNLYNKSDGFDQILRYLDIDLSNILKKMPLLIRKRVEEIRLRIGRPLAINYDRKDLFIKANGVLTDKVYDAYIVTEKNIRNTFQLISNYSIYAFEEEIRNGFITISGGHRIGITGKVIYRNNNIYTIKEISSLNIRISREKKGVSDKVIKYVIKKPNTIYNTLIVSPPQCGKTTLLRDLIRNLSNGIPKLDFYGLKIGVVDERTEIAGIYKGYPQNDIGLRTDVLDSCHKFDGMMLLVRSMSPNVIATDELGEEKDIIAIHKALKAGVKIISTVHGESINDLLTRPYLKQILKENIFERIILLSNRKGVGTIEDIIDGKTYKSIIKKEV